MKQLLLVLVALGALTGAQAQNENSIWYFGDHAGLDFRGGAPVPLSDGQTLSPEGTAMVSDAGGNLLFYTDGITVWNRNHTPMPNGIGLNGHLSSSQAAQIVRQPGGNSIYYIFTVYELGGNPGLNFSIVDMTQQGGLGDVTVKNSPLEPAVSEKIAIIPHCLDTVWVVAHRWESNAFLAYMLTSTGLDTTPVLSFEGSVHQGGSQGNFNAVGYMRASPDGTKLALAIRDMNSFEFFDFDKTTGVVSNAFNLQSPDYTVAYGVEFSPDGTKLYASSADTRSIYQFDLAAGSASAIAASGTLVGTSSSNFVGAMLLGPDGKIYVARSESYTIGTPWLGVINSPNTAGTGCNYVDNGLQLTSGLSLMGMPSYTHIPQPCATPPPPPLPVVPVGENVWAPNVFTPNGDGVNDVFEVANTGMTEVRCEVYDRWGIKMYESSSLVVRWDGYTTSGRPAAEGAYYYLVTGKGESGQDYKLKGAVQLLR